MPTVTSKVEAVSTHHGERLYVEIPLREQRRLGLVGGERVTVTIEVE